MISRMGSRTLAGFELEGLSFLSNKDVKLCQPKYGFAPFVSSRLQPFPSGVEIGCGTAYTCLPCFLAKSAVQRAPLFSLASTTMSSVDQALIKAFLLINCFGCGFVPGGN